MSETTRIYTPEKDLVPRALVRMMFGLVMLCLIMVSAHVWTGQPVASTPPDSAIKVQKTLFLQGDMSGSARVLDAHGTVIADLSSEEGGFISGIWRVLQRERTKARVPLEGPVTLTAFENGRMAILDPSTGWSADLMGFGQDNAAAFAKLLIE
jgi:putative photosynthetic complex assembly protein